ncbi:hypothetical protein C8F04DRAFT_923946, partial [Mycena alexandri]
VPVESLPPQEPENSPPVDPEPETPMTQTAKLMAEYMAKFPDILRLWVAHKSGAGVGTPCYCGNGVRSTRCRDCCQYELSYEFFVKHDISLVDSGGHLPTLGHYGRPCPNIGNSVMMTIVEPNGVHATKLFFCGCAENPSVDSRFDQLMEAGFFPGSVDSPRTGFSFEIMRRFHLASLESKTAALDFMSCLRRLTDNATTAKVPVSTVSRASNTSVDTEPIFHRHVLQQQSTLDGNFHTSHFAKNCDPHDVSLFNGKAHFPPDVQYCTYLKSIPLSTEVEFQKSTCKYLKAVNRQDKKKFKFQDVNGTINGQCSHVFVVASVDMHHSERFANADAALARMLRKMVATNNQDIQFRLAFENIDQVVTYEIACAYYVKIKARFRESPDLADVADI